MATMKMPMAVGGGGGQYAYGTVTNVLNQETEVTLGFKPKFILLMGDTQAYAAVSVYDENFATDKARTDIQASDYQVWDLMNEYSFTSPVANYPIINGVTTTGFTIQKTNSSSYAPRSLRYWAAG